MNVSRHHPIGRHSRPYIVIFLLGNLFGFAGCGTEKKTDQLHSAIDANDLKVLPEEERKAAEGLQDSSAIVSIEKGHVMMVRSNDGTFDNAGMVYLQALPELQILILVGDGITDKGLKHLHGLKKLAQIQLIGTRISGEAIETLRQHLGRRCKIIVRKI